MAEKADQGRTGGCQCGAIRYRLEGAPLRANICHCRMCQKAGAAPFMAFAAFPTEKFHVTKGETATFASSDIAERGFCAKCGTPLTYRTLQGSTISVTILSLDDPSDLEPDTQLGVESQVPWLAAALSLPAVKIEDWLARKKIAAVCNHQHPDREN